MRTRLTSGQNCPEDTSFVESINFSSCLRNSPGWSADTVTVFPHILVTCVLYVSRLRSWSMVGFDLSDPILICEQARGKLRTDNRLVICARTRSRGGWRRHAKEESLLQKAQKTTRQTRTNPSTSSGEQGIQKWLRRGQDQNLRVCVVCPKDGVHLAP